MMEKLNERLLYLRKNANLTQQQLADKLHISNKTISQWETGRTLPDIVMLVRLAEIYDMKLDELLNQKDQNAIPNEIMTKTLLMGNYKDYLSAYWRNTAVLWHLFLSSSFLHTLCDKINF